MVTRDDFLKLDEYSFGKCIDILEKYNDTRADLEFLLKTLGVEITAEVFDALDLTLEKFGKSDAIKLRRSILAQMKDEAINAEAVE